MIGKVFITFPLVFGKKKKKIGHGNDMMVSLATARCSIA
jgi:hypothetical protein